MCIYSSFSVSISPPFSLVVFVTLTKIKAVPNCEIVAFVVHEYPTSHCLCHHHARKLYGGTVHVSELEKIELIHGELCQECSLRYARNSRIGKLASRYFCNFLRFLCIRLYFIIISQICFTT